MKSGLYRRSRLRDLSVDPPAADADTDAEALTDEGLEIEFELAKEAELLVWYWLTKRLLVRS